MVSGVGSIDDGVSLARLVSRSRKDEIRWIDFPTHLYNSGKH